MQRIASLRGLLTGEASLCPHLRSNRLIEWTARALRPPAGACRDIQWPDGAVCRRAELPDGHYLFDMVDVDSGKWRSYGEHKA